MDYPYSTSGTPWSYLVQDRADAFALLLRRCSIMNVLNKGGVAAIHVAAETGDVDLCQNLLRNDADPSIETQWGQTPMDLARMRGHQEVEKLLQSAGGKCKIKKKGSLCRSAKRNKFRLLYSKLIRENKSAFFVTFFIKARLGYLLVNELQRAVGARLYMYVSQLLACGVPLNLAGSDGQTALHHAARHGHVDVFRLLLDHSTIGDANRSDRRGNTSLHVAAIYGKADVIQMLIDWGADASRTNEDGRLAVELAMAMGHEKTATLCKIALLFRETAV